MKMLFSASSMACTSTMPNTVLRVMVSTNPAARFQSAREAAKAIENVDLDLAEKIAQLKQQRFIEQTNQRYAAQDTAAAMAFQSGYCHSLFHANRITNIYKNRPYLLLDHIYSPTGQEYLMP